MSHDVHSLVLAVCMHHLGSPLLQRLCDVMISNDILLPYKETHHLPASQYCIIQFPYIMASSVVALAQYCHQNGTSGWVSKLVFFFHAWQIQFCCIEPTGPCWFIPQSNESWMEGTWAWPLPWHWSFLSLLLNRLCCKISDSLGMYLQVPKHPLYSVSNNWSMSQVTHVMWMQVVVAIVALSCWITWCV